MILLDTCTLLWITHDHSKLTKKALDAIADASMIYVSSISALEIAIKSKQKKLKLQKKPQAWFELACQLHGFNEIPLNAEILTKSADLPDHHKDPFDRMIIATAKLHDLAIISADSLFKKYRQVKTVW